MKLLLPLALFFLSIDRCYAQAPIIEVRSMEYTWERPGDDKRIVFAQDTVYRQSLKRSFINAITDRWGVEVPDFEVKVNKLSAMRTQPKFNPKVPDADTAKWYIFFQLFDRTIPGTVQSYSANAANIDVKYRLIKGGVAENKSASFNIIKTTPPPGQVRLDRFPYHPSALQYACDTIFRSMLSDVTKSANEISLDAACGFSGLPVNAGMNVKDFQFRSNRQAISVTGAFTIVHDSVNVVQTGKKKHVAGNAAAGLLTLFSNIDTEKEKSALYTADHSFSDGSDVFHAYVSYIDTKVAERRRVKDEEGFKSLEVGEYQHGWREIKPGVVHVITLNGDTVATFNIQFHRKEEHFSRMWNGRDSATVDSLPASFNNPARIEMEMKGNIGKNQFELTTTDEGRIKKLSMDGDEVFSFYNSNRPEGMIAYRNLNEHVLKIATILCLVSNKYYQ